MIGLGSQVAVSNSYSLVNVTTGGYGGSFVGLLQGGSSLTNVYSGGTVTSDFGKGMIGANSNTYFDPLLPGSVTSANVFTNDFYDSTTGSVGSSGKGTPKSTDQMLTQGTYTSWDFISTWKIDPLLNSGYPYLSGVQDTVPASPIASPAAGTFTSTQSVTLSSTGSYSIRYSTSVDPSDCSSGALYSGPISVASSQTLYVRACNLGFNYSTSSFAYIITPPVAPTPIITSSSHSSETPVYGCKDPKATNYNYFSASNPSLCVYPKVVVSDAPPTETTSPTMPTISEIHKVTKNLKFGMKDGDVRILQQFLINQDKGPAARILKNSDTTNFFGHATKTALIEWQKSNNIAPASGYFGQKTRTLIKSLTM